MFLFRLLFRRKKKEKELDLEKDNPEKEELPIRKKKNNQEEDETKPKKKKEYKPWGKKERLLVFGVFVVTIFLSSILGLVSRDWKLSNFPKLTFPKVNLSLTKTIVMPASSEEPIMKYDFSKVITKFNNKTKELTGTYSLYVIDIESGTRYGVYEKEIFQAASLIKLPLMALSYKMFEDGKIDFSENYILKSSDKVGGSGSLYYKPDGTKYLISELVYKMGKESDNTSFNVLNQMIGNTEIDNFLEEEKMSNTSFENNDTTPFEIGELLYRIWQGKIISSFSQDKFFESLTNTSYEKHMRAGIPEEIEVIHKYGREIHVVNEAGIIKTKKPFIVVIMSRGVDDSEADSEFAELTSIVFEEHQSIFDSRI